eukprot:Clim_evm66s147 gene=Clim_evmTU66s147
MTQREAFPPPPQFFEQFTSEDDDDWPIPPAFPTEKVMVFGRPIFVTGKSSTFIESLEAIGGESVYDDDTAAKIDKRLRLKKVTLSIMLKYLEILQTIGSDTDPQHLDVQERIAELEQLFVNGQYTANEYRLHQAEETVISMAKLQTLRRTRDIEAMRKAIEQAREDLKECGSILTISDDELQQRENFLRRIDDIVTSKPTDDDSNSPDAIQGDSANGSGTAERSAAEAALAALRNGALDG